MGSRMSVLLKTGMAVVLLAAAANARSGSAYAGVPPLPDGCYDCTDCGAASHFDNAGSTMTAGFMHGSCSAGSCYDMHYGYGIVSAPRNDPRSTLEVRALVARVEAA